MNFESAMSLLREGQALTRQVWKDKRQCVTLEHDEYSKFFKVIPCRVANYTHAKLGYNPTPSDLLANDWELI